MLERLDEKVTQETGEALTLSFDLRTEPWLPVVWQDGTIAEIGLVELFHYAHGIREIRDPLPSVECGLLRLLVAFALDILQMRDSDDWEEVWNVGSFDRKRVDAYFEKYGDRFDLFSSTHPFLQSATADGDDKPLAGLIPSQPSGSNAAHFHHGDERDFAVSPAIAARLLTAIAPFMTSGGAGLPPSINGAPPWYVVLQGGDANKRNLFQTLLLNCVVIEDLLLAHGDEIPAWRDERVVVKEDRTSASLLESLTWRPRRIRLVPRVVIQGSCALTGQKATVLVARMKFSPGSSTRFEWRDPNVAYRIGKDGALVLRPREGREVWRDVGALAFLREESGSGAERPAVVTQFAEFLKDRRLPQNTPLHLALYGMRSDLKMKIFEWFRQEMSLPAPLLLNQSFSGRAQGEMQLAEDVAYAIKSAVKKTYPRDGAGNDKAFESLIVRAQSDFWHRLRPHYADGSASLLFRLAELDVERDQAEIATAVADWRHALRQVAQRVLDQAIGSLNGAVSGLDADGQAMKRQVEAHRFFSGRLWALLHPEEAAKAKEKKKAKGATA